MVSQQAANDQPIFFYQDKGIQDIQAKSFKFLSQHHEAILYVYFTGRWNNHLSLRISFTQFCFLFQAFALFSSDCT